jgi:hypothetical protein
MNKFAKNKAVIEDKKALIESIPALKDAAEKFYGKKEIGIAAGRIL